MYMYSTFSRVAEQGASRAIAPPPNIFRSNAKKNYPVRTCKEHTAKCEIKNNYHLEKLNDKACCNTRSIYTVHPIC